MRDDQSPEDYFGYDDEDDTEPDFEQMRDDHQSNLQDAAEWRLRSQDLF